MIKTKHERDKVGISQQEKTCWTEFRNSVQQRNALILCRLHLLLRSGQHLKINGDHYRSHATQTLAEQPNGSRLTPAPQTAYLLNEACVPSYGSENVRTHTN